MKQFRPSLYVALAMVLLIGMLGIYVLRGADKQESAGTDTANTIGQDSGSNRVNPELASGYAVYENNKLDFSFLYPEKWTIEEDPYGFWATFTDPSTRTEFIRQEGEIMTNGASIRVQADLFSSLVGTYDESLKISEDTLQIAGYNATRTLYKAPGTTLGQSSGVTHYLLVADFIAPETFHTNYNELTKGQRYISIIIDSTYDPLLSPELSTIINALFKSFRVGTQD